MLLGAALVIAALLLFHMNRQEDSEAGSAAQDVLPAVVAQIEQRSARLSESSVTPPSTPAPETATESTPAPTERPLYVDPYDTEMTVATIGGDDYIGCIAIPAIDIELPVMSDWSYPKLRKSPCRYAGSTKTDDLVVFAHNYSRHFGRLYKLSPGDEIIFTDMDGVVSRYRVIDIETLSPYSVPEVTSGEYDLTLFTCTYGGSHRVTVRADRQTEFASNSCRA